METPPSHLAAFKAMALTLVASIPYLAFGRHGNTFTNFVTWWNGFIGLETQVAKDTCEGVLAAIVPVIAGCLIWLWLYALMVWADADDRRRRL